MFPNAVLPSFMYLFGRQCCLLAYIERDACVAIDQVLQQRPASISPLKEQVFEPSTTPLALKHGNLEVRCWLVCSQQLLVVAAMLLFLSIAHHNAVCRCGARGTCLFKTLSKRFVRGSHLCCCLIFCACGGTLEVHASTVDTAQLRNAGACCQCGF